MYDWNELALLVVCLFICGIGITMLVRKPSFPSWRSVRIFKTSVPVCTSEDFKKNSLENHNKAKMTKSMKSQDLSEETMDNNYIL